MTLDDLIERLTELQDDGYGDCRVRLAFQPSWPLALEIGRITPLRAEADEDEDDDDYDGPLPPRDPDDEYVVWIADGGHPNDASPYAPDGAFG